MRHLALDTAPGVRLTLGVLAETPPVVSTKLAAPAPPLLHPAAETVLLPKSVPDPLEPPTQP